MLSIFRQLVSGEYYNVKSFANSSEIPINQLREKFDELEEEGILVNIYGDFYVLQDLTEKEKQEAVEKIKELSYELQQEINQSTDVKISGELVENYSFTTDKEPGEIVK